LTKDEGEFDAHRRYDTDEKQDVIVTGDNILCVHDGVGSKKSLSPSPHNQIREGTQSPTNPNMRSRLTGYIQERPYESILTPNFYSRDISPMQMNKQSIHFKSLQQAITPTNQGTGFSCTYDREDGSSKKKSANHSMEVKVVARNTSNASNQMIAEASNKNKRTNLLKTYLHLKSANGKAKQAS